jgi:hypothetical protein
MKYYFSNFVIMLSVSLEGGVLIERFVFLALLILCLGCYVLHNFLFLWLLRLQYGFCVWFSLFSILLLTMSSGFYPGAEPLMGWTGPWPAPTFFFSIFIGVILYIVISVGSYHKIPHVRVVELGALFLKGPMFNPPWLQILVFIEYFHPLASNFGFYWIFSIEKEY